MKTSVRRRPAWAVCSLALACVCATAALPAGDAERGPLRRTPAVAPAETEARVIVKYKADSTLMRALSANTGSAAVPPQHAQELGGRLGLALTDGRTIGARAQVVRGTGLSSRRLAEQLAAQSDVEYAVVDERKYALAAPNDPRYASGQAGTPVSGQWYLRAPTSATIVDATSIVSSINAEAAWNVSTGNSAVVVAVLDTGVRFDHPDLAGKLRPGYDFAGGSGSAAAIALANDGDGRDADASDPGDWITLAEDTQQGGQFYHCGDKDSSGAYVGAPSSWHGTQTSGLIGAATNNGIGMAGAGRDVMLLPVRVLGKCGGYDSDIQAAMLWAAGLSASPTVNPYPAKVINLSLGSTGTCSQSYVDTFKTLIDNRVVVVAAAGNDGLAVGTPANCAGVIAVAGVRHAGTKVGYSDLGPEIAISAPAGNCVNSTGTCLFPLLTTSNSGSTTPVSNANGGSIYTGGGNDASLGTSFSSPLVAGTVGLMVSANSNLSPSQLRYAMTSTARAFPQTGAGASISACTAPTATAQSSECYCTTATCGAGLLDASLAVTRAAGVAAIISASATSVTAGATVDLNASGSWPGAGASGSLGYQWTSSAGSATFSGPTNASTATLVTTAPGAVTATLTVTDSLGRQASSNVALSVAAAPVTPGGNSSGGGALDPLWLLGWLAAVIGVRAVTPRIRRR